MHGLMMDAPLTITSIMRHASINHPDSRIVSVTADDPRRRLTYAEVFARAARLANALAASGLARGERIATLAWNDHRHFELYYAASCAGHVLHTVNPRLFPEQIVYVLTHADDRLVFTDPMFVPLLEKLADRLSHVRRFVVLTDDDHMPATALPGACSYETFIAGQPAAFDWPTLEEKDASSLCYTSGTTGHPKGVLYSHRSSVLHALTCCMPDTMDLSARDTVLPVVPMFHVNAWGVPYAAPIVGADLVLPGPKMGDGGALHDLIESEGVSCALGVPTVWLALLGYTRSSGKRLESLQRVLVGGSACPAAIMDEFAEQHDVRTHHAWGMTETSPLGTFNTETPAVAALAQDERDAIRLKQGRSVFGVEMRIVDADGNELPRDGEAFGQLQVRGPWVCSAYFGGDDAACALTGDGWFDTGDVATIDVHGFMQITDRTKDVIKSGGEWISSIELENLAMGFPGVREAAVIGVPHPKWAERPLLIVLPAPGETIDTAALLQHFQGQGSELVGAGRGGSRRRHPAHRHRQDQQEDAARALRRLHIARRRLRPGNPGRG
jgi:acyl-CoA synthetase (AMP-forming)/AMP-acid ligase II